MPGASVQIVQSDANNLKDIPVDMGGMVAASVAQQVSAAQSAAALGAMAGANGQNAFVLADVTTPKAIVAANPARKGVPSLYFDGAAILYVTYGTAGTPGPTNYVVKLGQGLLTYWEPPVGVYTGALRGAFSAVVAGGGVAVGEVI